MKIAVDRKALEINRRISDPVLHHPPILVKYDDGTVTRVFNFPLPYGRAMNWRVVYEPDPQKVWIEVGDDGEPIAFNVWIENI